MNQSKRGLIPRILFLSAGLLAGAALAWFARGAYDKIFMMEGHFHIVSVSGEDHDVRLEFPSGERLDFSLKKGGSINFRVNDTGEGSIAVSIDGGSKKELGYVTSFNSIVIVTISEDQAWFSQIFPGSDAEEPQG